MAFADNLRYIMACRDMSQAQVTQAGGFSVGSLYQWTHGKAIPYTRNMERLCRVLHCTAADLYGETLPVDKFRRWAPNRETCERKLTEHLSPAIGPQPCMDETDENMAVISRMMQNEPTPAPAPAPVAPALLLSDLQALFDACVDDNDPAVIFTQFGKQVYQLMVETRKEGTK